jgi:MFS family permease
MAAEIGGTGRSGWYYGWNIVAVLMIVLISSMGLGVSSFSLFLHDWSTDLKVPISTLQLAVTPGATMSAVSGAVIGGLADRYPARWLIGGGLLAMAVFDLCLSLVNNTWQFLALFALVLPILLNLTTLIVANPLVSRWFVKRLGLALGLTALGVGLAGVVVSKLVAEALPLVGWRGVWRISAGVLAFGVAPLVFLVVRERPTEREGLSYVSGDGGAHGGHHHAKLPQRAIVGRKNFWFIAAMYLPIFSAFQGIAYNLAPIAASHGVDAKTAGTLLVILSLTQMAATPLLGMLSDRFGNRLPFLGLAIVTAA